MEEQKKQIISYMTIFTYNATWKATVTRQDLGEWTQVSSRKDILLHKLLDQDGYPIEMIAVTWVLFGIKSYISFCTGLLNKHESILLGAPTSASAPGEF